MSSLSSKNNKIINWMLVVIFTMAVSLSSSVAVFAQDETNKEAVTDTAVNKTMKSLFSEAKKVAKKDDGNMFSIIMISVVVIIVIIAVWLSFRPDEEDRAREKKKKDAAAAAAANATN
ncbi:MAG: hypothetical protein V4667_02270 [Bacteroidota bacterium]